MRLTITLDCDNAAFEENPGEAARILEAVARQLGDCATWGEAVDWIGDVEPVRLRDFNGNACGTVALSD